MTEQEWLTSNNPSTMLTWLMNRAENIDALGQATEVVSDRKLRLFAVACCRQVWHLLDDIAPCPTCNAGVTRYDGPRPCSTCGGTGRIKYSRRAVEVVERYADGLATEKELRDTNLAANNYAATRCNVNAAYYTFSWLAFYVSDERPSYLADNIRNVLDLTRGNRITPATQAALLRDIVGNPFQPWHRFGQSGNDAYEIRGEWITPTVLAIAQAAYEEQDGTRRVIDPRGNDDPAMNLASSYTEKDEPDGSINSTTLAVLSDALEDAGCAEEAILEHLRSPSPHVRGCWAVDMILGKE